jgi:hypothetical protein
MNKKLIVLLVPLLLLPMVSYTYAHFYDYVTKQYKIHVGSVEAKIEYYNVTYLMFDDLGPECGHVDGIFGDEIVISIGESDCTWYVNVTIDPALPGMIMESEMLIHNIGKLPWRIETLAGYPAWDGPYDDDPCFDPDITGSLPSWVSYTKTLYRHDPTLPDGYGKGCFDPDHYTLQVGETGWAYCNCTSVLVKQRLELLQDEMKPLQKDIECNWFRLVQKYEVASEDPTEQDEYFEWWNP